MTETPQELFARAEAAASTSDDGRLVVGEMADWDVFPFEREGLRVKPLLPPVDHEPPRYGEDGQPCGSCGGSTPKTDGTRAIWSDERWHIVAPEPSGSPLVLLLEPHAHLDLPELTDELAGELGLLTVRLTAAIEALPGIARAHVARWGDGGSHAHLWFIARPHGFTQLRGTMMAVWDDLLPPAPLASRDAAAAAVIQTLVATWGGQASSSVAAP